MCLSLETLTSIIRTGQPILVELIDLVNSIIIFCISKNLTQMVNFPTLIPDCDSHSPALLDLFLSMVLVFFLQWLSQWRIQRLIWAHRKHGKISWVSVSPPAGTEQSPVGGWGAKPLENFDDSLVKITFLKLNMPFYER